MNERIAALLHLFILVIIVGGVDCRGVLSIKLSEFHNPSGRTFDGGCCDAGRRTDDVYTVCGDGCDYVMRLIVSGLGRANDHVFLFHRPLKYNSNDVIFPQHDYNMVLTVLFDQWPAHDRVKMSAFFYDYDDLDHTTTLVDWFVADLRNGTTGTNGDLTRDSNGSVHTQTMTGKRRHNKTKLVFDWSVLCNEGSDCTQQQPSSDRHTSPQTTPIFEEFEQIYMGKHPDDTRRMLENPVYHSRKELKTINSRVPIQKANNEIIDWQGSKIDRHAIATHKNYVKSRDDRILHQRVQEKYVATNELHTQNIQTHKKSLPFRRGNKRLQSRSFVENTRHGKQQSNKFGIPGKNNEYKHSDIKLVSSAAGATPPTGVFLGHSTKTYSHKSKITKIRSGRFLHRGVTKKDATTLKPYTQNAQNNEKSLAIPRGNKRLKSRHFNKKSSFDIHSKKYDKNIEDRHSANKLVSAAAAATPPTRAFIRHSTKTQGHTSNKARPGRRLHQGVTEVATTININTQNFQNNKKSLLLSKGKPRLKSRRFSKKSSYYKQSKKNDEDIKDKLPVNKFVSAAAAATPPTGLLLTHSTKTREQNRSKNRPKSMRYPNHVSTKNVGRQLHGNTVRYNKNHGRLHNSVNKGGEDHYITEHPTVSRNDGSRSQEKPASVISLKKHSQINHAKTDSKIKVHTSFMDSNKEKSVKPDKISHTTRVQDFRAPTPKYQSQDTLSSRGSNVLAKRKQHEKSRTTATISPKVNKQNFNQFSDMTEATVPTESPLQRKTTQLSYPATKDSTRTHKVSLEDETDERSMKHTQNYLPKIHFDGEHHVNSLKHKLQPEERILSEYLTEEHKKDDVEEYNQHETGPHSFSDPPKTPLKNNHNPIKTVYKEDTFSLIHLNKPEKLTTRRPLERLFGLEKQAALYPNRVAARRHPYIETKEDEHASQIEKMHYNKPKQEDKSNHMANNITKHKRPQHQKDFTSRKRTDQEEFKLGAAFDRSINNVIVPSTKVQSKLISGVTKSIYDSNNAAMTNRATAKPRMGSQRQNKNDTSEVLAHTHKIKGVKSKANKPSTNPRAKVHKVWESSRPDDIKILYNSIKKLKAVKFLTQAPVEWVVTGHSAFKKTRQRNFHDTPYMTTMNAQLYEVTSNRPPHKMTTGSDHLHFAYQDTHTKMESEETRDILHRVDAEHVEDTTSNYNPNKNVFISTTPSILSIHDFTKDVDYRRIDALGTLDKVQETPILENKYDYPDYVKRDNVDTKMKYSFVNAAAKSPVSMKMMPIVTRIYQKSTDTPTMTRYTPEKDNSASSPIGFRYQNVTKEKGHERATDIKLYPLERQTEDEHLKRLDEKEPKMRQDSRENLGSLLAHENKVDTKEELKVTKTSTITSKDTLPTIESFMETESSTISHVKREKANTIATGIPIKLTHTNSRTSQNTTHPQLKDLTRDDTEREKAFSDSVPYYLKFNKALNKQQKDVTKSHSHNGNIESRLVGNELTGITNTAARERPPNKETKSFVDDSKIGIKYDSHSHSSADFKTDVISTTHSNDNTSEMISLPNVKIFESSQKYSMIKIADTHDRVSDEMNRKNNSGNKQRFKDNNDTNKSASNHLHFVATTPLDVSASSTEWPEMETFSADSIYMTTGESKPSKPPIEFIKSTVSDSKLIHHSNKPLALNFHDQRDKQEMQNSKSQQGSLLHVQQEKDLYVKSTRGTESARVNKYSLVSIDPIETTSRQKLSTEKTRIVSNSDAGNVYLTTDKDDYSLTKHDGPNESVDLLDKHDKQPNENAMFFKSTEDPNHKSSISDSNQAITTDRQKPAIRNTLHSGKSVKNMTLTNITETMNSILTQVKRYNTTTRQGDFEKMKYEFSSLSNSSKIVKAPFLDNTVNDIVSEENLLRSNVATLTNSTHDLVTNVARNFRSMIARFNKIVASLASNINDINGNDSTTASDDVTTQEYHSTTKVTDFTHLTKKKIEKDSSTILSSTLTTNVRKNPQTNIPNTRTSKHTTPAEFTIHTRKSDTTNTTPKSHTLPHVENKNNQIENQDAGSTKTFQHPTQPEHTTNTHQSDKTYTHTTPPKTHTSSHIKHTLKTIDDQEDFIVSTKHPITSQSLSPKTQSYPYSSSRFPPFSHATFHIKTLPDEGFKLHTQIPFQKDTASDIARGSIILPDLKLERQSKTKHVHNLLPAKVDIHKLRQFLFEIRHAPKVKIPTKGLFEEETTTTEPEVNEIGNPSDESSRLSKPVLKRHKAKANLNTVFTRYWPALFGVIVGTVFLLSALITSLVCRQRRFFIRRWTDSPQHLSEPPDTSEYATSSAASLHSDFARSSTHLV